MSTAIAKSGEIKETSLGELRARADGLESEVQKLEASLVASRLRQENLIAERGSLIVPARSQKNPDAQKRLRAIGEQSGPLAQDIADDEAALSELKGQLCSAEENLEREEWELQRTEVRRMLEARLKGKNLAAIEKAIRDLAVALQAAADEDEAVRVATLSFAPSLHREVSSLIKAGRERSRFAAWMLRDVLPVDTRELGNNQAWTGRGFGDTDRLFYGRMLASLDGLSLRF